MPGFIGSEIEPALRPPSARQPIRVTPRAVAGRESFRLIRRAHPFLRCAASIRAAVLSMR